MSVTTFVRAAIPIGENGEAFTPQTISSAGYAELICRDGIREYHVIGTEAGARWVRQEEFARWLRQAAARELKIAERRADLLRRVADGTTTVAIRKSHHDPR